MPGGANQRRRTLNDAPAQPVEQLTELLLTKSGQRWVFRYRAGDEPAVLRSIAQAAGDPARDRGRPRDQRGLDWSDAAALARQMGYRLCESFKEPS